MNQPMVYDHKYTNLKTKRMTRKVLAKTSKISKSSEIKTCICIIKSIYLFKNSLITV